jgi:hypothetical protein
MVKRLIVISLLLFISCGNRVVSQKEASDLNKDLVKSDSSIFDYSNVIANLKEKISDNFYITTFSSFVIVSNLNIQETEKIINSTIAKSEECFYKDYFDKKPDKITTVFLFKDDKSYSYWAKKLYRDEDLSRFGYFKPDENVMLMNISTGSGTLVHELTHCFINYDFPDIPAWFNEGLGSLYERSSLNNNKILGYVNWRLPELQDAISEKSYTSLETLMKMSDKKFYGNGSLLNYAQARYFCLYLQQKGLLINYYRTFRDRFDEDKTGIKFLEEIIETDLNEFDKNFVEWVKGLEYKD